MKKSLIILLTFLVTLSSCSIDQAITISKYKKEYVKRYTLKYGKEPSESEVVRFTNLVKTTKFNIDTIEVDHSNYGYPSYYYNPYIPNYYIYNYRYIAPVWHNR